jgi:hypothetical protein
VKPRSVHAAGLVQQGFLLQALVRTVTVIVATRLLNRATARMPARLPLP